MNPGTSADASAANGTALQHIAIDQPALPSGEGSIAGLQATFGADNFTGTLTGSIMFALPAARGLEPAIALRYNAAGGNGPYGLGFDLELPKISIRAQTVPRYDGHDSYTFSGRILEPDRSAAAVRRSDNGVDFDVSRFRPVIETDFTIVERWTRSSDGDVHWRVTERDAKVSQFGTGADSRIDDPADARRVFSWLPTTVADAKGNRILFEYRAEDDAGIPPAPENTGRDHRANRYLGAVRYGNYQAADGTTAWMFSVLFDYGDYDLSPTSKDPAKPVRPWTVRPDPFSTYRPGFELRTWRRCNGILVTHNFPAELGADPVLTRSLTFAFDPNAPLSQIVAATETGWRRYGTGDATTLSKPPLTLTWTEARAGPRAFAPIDIASSGQFGPPIDDDPPKLVDLDGEGLPGLLVSTPSELLYWRNAGGGRFTGPTAPRGLPNLRDFGAEGIRLSSIDRFARLDVVVEAPGMAGYFGNRGAAGYAPFEPFESFALQALDPDSERIDLTGNGLSDVLSVATGAVSWSLSHGALGYGPTRIAGNPLRIPRPGTASPVRVVQSADMFGDGLQHLVEIGTGRVRVWPNLGYGRFAAPVEIANAPSFPDGVPADRVHLVDTDGSGTADIVVVEDSRLVIYPNTAGNSFGPPSVVTLPAPYETIDAITFGDVLARGTTAAIVSLATGTQRHFYFDFTDGRRLSLIASIDDGHGAITRVAWQPSTAFQLADARAGQPWITTLPFPVQVVETIRREDRISGGTTTSRFAYRDPYYDPVLFAFRGFAGVETWDAEVFASTKATADTADTAAIPTHRKHWFINGAYEELPLLEASWRAAFYHGAQPGLALPVAVLQLGQSSAGGRVQRQAWSALAGARVRTETYGLDGTAAAAVPYTVEQAASTVTLLQAPDDDGFGVFFVAGDQSAETAYERVPDDPRTTQAFTLTRTPHGLPLIAASLAYPRRASVTITPLPQQSILRASTSVTAYATPVDGSAIEGLPAQETSYELAGLTPDANGFFTADTLRAQIDIALVAPLLPEQPFSGTAPQARYQTIARVRYLGTDGQPLPLREVTSPALAWRTTTAVFTPGMITADFGTRLTDAMITGCGYEKDGSFWWQPSNAASYAPAAQFCVLVQAQDPFGNRTTATYDSYSLMLVGLTDALGATLCTTPDYQALAPAAIVSINNVTQQALYDPLGELMVTSVFGTINGQRQGDGDLTSYVVRVPPSVADVITNAELYLQDATEYFYRDPHGYAATRGPSASAHLARQTHLSDADQSLPMTKTVVYFDGERRTLQTKSLVEGAAVGNAADRWVTSGRTVYDTKGQPVRAYLPTLTDTFAWTADPGLLFDTTYYDAPGREISTLNAKGFITRTDYAAWSETSSDADDTVKTSPYYIANIGNRDPDFALQREALVKAAVFENTPQTDQFGPRRITIQTDQRLVSSVDPTPQVLSTVLTVDGQGRVVTTADPRFSAWNADHTDKRFNVTTAYDMGETALLLTSCDAGTTRQLATADGQPAYQWTAAGVLITRSYDALRRPLSVRVDGAGLAQIVEAFSYGTDAASNLNGRLIEHKDQAGILAFSAYDIDGVAIATSRQVLSDAGATVNWNPGVSPPLDPPIAITSTYAIDGKILSETGPGGSLARFGYYRTGWAAGQSFTPQGATTVDVVSAATYNARGQRLSATFGNGTVSALGYEDSTGRVITVTTTRTSDNKRLQDIAYVYDPVGNITEIVDNSVNDIVAGHDLVDPGCAFTNDSLYRLIESTGRQSPAIGPDTYHTGFMGTAFVPVQGNHPNDTAQLIRYRETYAYDNSDNPLTLQHVTDGNVADFSRTYLVSQTSNHSVEATSSATVSPDDVYDAGGNMIALPFVRTLSWSYRNTLSSAVVVTRNGAANDQQLYLYDADGNRVEKVTGRLVNVATGTIDRSRSITFGHYRLDQRETVDTDGNATMVERSLMISLAFGGDLQLTVRSFDQSIDPHSPAPQWRYQYSTNLASIDLELDQSGQVTSYEEYFAFGGSAFIAGPDQVAVSGKIFRYCGKECDNLTSLYYYGARYYASWMGRWISADPLGTADGLNLYCYVGDNPVSYADPDGTTKKPVDQGGSGSGGNSAPQPNLGALRVNPVIDYVHNNPGKTWFASSAIGTGVVWNLLGLQFATHVTMPGNYAKIKKEGLRLFAGAGLTPPSKGGPIAGAAKSFPEAATLNATGRVFYGKILATLVYANQVKIKLDAIKKGLDPGQVIKQTKGFTAYLHHLNPFVSQKNTIKFLLPPQITANFERDPDSLLKVFDNKKTGWTLWEHLYSQQGFSTKMANTFLFPGWRSKVPGFAGIDPRYIVGSPSFNLSGILGEALASVPELFGKAAVTSTLKINFVAGSIFVTLLSSIKFLSDTTRKE
jgi:RHS repeat-associated protein